MTRVDNNIFVAYGGTFADKRIFGLVAAKAYELRNVTGEIFTTLRDVELSFADIYDPSKIMMLSSGAVGDIRNIDSFENMLITTGVYAANGPYSVGLWVKDNLLGVSFDGRSQMYSLSVSTTNSYAKKLYDQKRQTFHRNDLHILYAMWQKELAFIYFEKH